MYIKKKIEKKIDPKHSCITPALISHSPYWITESLAHGTIWECDICQQQWKLCGVRANEAPFKQWRKVIFRRKKFEKRGGQVLVGGISRLEKFPPKVLPSIPDPPK